MQERIIKKRKGIKIFDDPLSIKLITKKEYEMIGLNMSQGISFFNPTFKVSKEEALSNLETFTSKWKRKYPRVIDILDKNTYLLTYFDYPKEVRHSIYSTNLIEGFNKQLKKKFKLKEQFPTETSMEKYSVSQLNQYNCIHEIKEYIKDCNIQVDFIKVDTLEKAKNIPCIFNNWAVFKNGKYVSHILLNKKGFEKLLND